MRMMRFAAALLALAGAIFPVCETHADDEFTLKFGFSPNEMYPLATPLNVAGAHDMLSIGIDHVFGHSALARGTAMAFDEFVGFHLSIIGHEYGGHAEAFFQMTGHGASVTIGLFNQSHANVSVNSLDPETRRKFNNEGGGTILDAAGLNYQANLGEMLTKRTLGRVMRAREHLMRLTNDISLLAYVVPTHRPNIHRLMVANDLTSYMTDVTGSRLYRADRLYNQLLAGGVWQALGSWIDIYGAGTYLLYGEELTLPRTWVRPETTLTPYGVEYGLLVSTLDIPGLGSAAAHFYAGGGESLSALSKNMLRAKVEVENFAFPYLGTKVSLGVEYYRNSAEGLTFHAEAIQPLTKHVGLGVEARVKPFRGFSPDFYSLPNNPWSARYTALITVTP